MLTNKQVWGTNLGQRGQKRDFWVKNDGFPREKTQEQGLCPSVTCWVSSSSLWRLHSVEPRVLGRFEYLGSIRTSEIDSFDVFNY